MSFTGHMNIVCISEMSISGTKWGSTVKACMGLNNDSKRQLPTRVEDLIQHLKDIVEGWYKLGVQVDVPINTPNEIRYNNPGDVYQCKLLMLQEWQRRPTLKSSWCTLVDVLHKMEENVIADRASQQFSELVYSSPVCLYCYPSI